MTETLKNLRIVPDGIKIDENVERSISDALLFGFRYLDIPYDADIFVFLSDSNNYNSDDYDYHSYGRYRCLTRPYNPVHLINVMMEQTNFSQWNILTLFHEIVHMKQSIGCFEQHFKNRSNFFNLDIWIGECPKKFYDREYEAFNESANMLEQYCMENDWEIDIDDWNTKKNEWQDMEHIRDLYAETVRTRFAK